jgi:hypothetical protein
MSRAHDVHGVADQVSAICARLFPHAGPTGDTAVISEIVAVDPSWQPDVWCETKADDLRDVLRLAPADVGVAVVVAATAMLERDRFHLARVWARSFQWRDLVTIADAACERLPDPV